MPQAETKTKPRVELKQKHGGKQHQNSTCKTSNIQKFRHLERWPILIKSNLVLSLPFLDEWASVAGMSTSGQVQSRFQTSIDIARRQAYHVAPVAGQKRPPTEPTEQVSDIPPLALVVKQTTFPRQNVNPDTILESAPLQSARDLLTAPVHHFTASKIYPGTGAGAEPSPDDHQKAVAATAPPSSQNPLLSLSNPKYGLPPALTTNFAALGVRNIYPWQASCLLARGLLSGERHLVYTAPTGGGKSIVADVLLLKRIIENPGRKALLVLPYVALVQEKLKWMRRIVQDVERNIPDDEDDDKFPRRRWKKLHKNIRVTGFFGGSRTTATWANTDIAVCTIEKVCTIAVQCCLQSSDLPFLRPIR